jgi:NhaP-type Na+/H+ or K+/H+ antiporter
MSDLNIAFLLIAAALVISALISGLVVRGPISFPIIFLGLGLILGATQDGAAFDIHAHDPLLEAVATASLAFVLFLDALKLRVDEVGKDWAVPALILGPGTLITVALVAVPSVYLLDLSWVHGLLLGAVLASTDPVVVRDIARDRRLPKSIRSALSLEAGINDVIVLPLILVLIAVDQSQLSNAGDVLSFAGEVFIVGPVIGAVVAGGGAWLMTKVDARVGISREYQALFGVGLVLLTYVAAVAAGGDGFLAAFAGGIGVVVFNQELCDCFMEFGETLVEMLMLLAFVLFGIALAGLLGDVDLLPTLVVAAIAIFLARPAAIGVSLARAHIGLPGKAFLAWFGPRGLSSLLLALLLVQAGLGGAEVLLGIAGLVVLVSVLLHGVSATPLTGLYEKHLRTRTEEEERRSDVIELLSDDTEGFRRISIGGLLEQLDSDDPPTIVDVRSRSQYLLDPTGIPTGVRIPLDEVEQWARELPEGGRFVTYCTCPDEASSGRAARILTRAGHEAWALTDGMKAWQEATREKVAS